MCKIFPKIILHLGQRKKKKCKVEKPPRNKDLKGWMFVSCLRIYTFRIIINIYFLYPAPLEKIVYSYFNTNVNAYMYYNVYKNL